MSYGPWHQVLSYVLLSYVLWSCNLHTVLRPKVLLFYVLWSYCHMSYGPTVLRPMVLLSYICPMISLSAYVLWSYCHICPMVLQSYVLQWDHRSDGTRDHRTYDSMTIGP